MNSGSLSEFQPTWPKGCWPDEVQRLLLLACLSPDTSLAQDAFRQWSRKVEFFFIDSGSHTLLLMLYERLKQWNLPYGDMPRLKGIARFFWVRHQSQRREMLALNGAFAAAGIDILLLKGAALNATVYDAGTRVMADIDIAVRRRDAEAAMKVLHGLGYTAQFRHVERLSSATHGCHYRRGDAEVDLHWDFFHGHPLNDDAQDVLWDAADRIVVNGVTVRTLCATDQFLHTCEHGLRANETAPFRWLADACLILRRGGGMDWKRLATLARQFELVEQVKRSLRYLDVTLGEPVPDQAFKELQARPATLASRLEFFFTTRRTPGSHPFWQQLPGHLFAYRRARRIKPDLALSDYLIVVNDFDPPLRANVMSLLALEAIACVKAATSLARRGWLALRGRGRDIYMNVFDKDGWDGFFPPEVTLHGVFRWSTPNAGIHLPIRDHHRHVTLRLAAVRPWSGDLDRSLSFRVNRHVITPDKIRFNRWKVSFDVEPSMLVRQDLQRLEIRCKPWQAVDSRELGVPVKDVLLSQGAR